MIMCGRNGLLGPRHTELGGPQFARMFRSDRTVIGYHGTTVSRAERIAETGAFIPSRNDYDWLGHGIYFWEYAPGRAWHWARQKYGAEAAVLSAAVYLGFCLDLTDIRFTTALKTAYDGLREAYLQSGRRLPGNKGKARYLDCLVINYVAQYVLPGCDTVRAPFLEGQPIYEGAAFLSESHIQLVVRNPSCMLGQPQIVTPEVTDAH